MKILRAAARDGEWGVLIGSGGGAMFSGVFFCFPFSVSLDVSISGR